MPKDKRKDRAGGLSAKLVEETTTPIINDLERAAISTPLVNPALRQLASGGVSTARPGREAAFDVIASAVQTVERVLAVSRTRAGRALGVRSPQPRPRKATVGGDVAAAIAAANAAAAAANSAAMAAQAAATMVASMMSGAGGGSGGAGVAGGPGRDAEGAEFPGRPMAHMTPMVAMAMPRLALAPDASVTSPLVRSRADLGTGRLRERRAVHHGAAFRVPMTVTNGTNRPLKGLTLRSSDLVSSKADRIPSGAVSFDPPRLDLARGARAVVTATIEVPADARPGSYTGRVYGPNHQGVETILSFSVR